MVSRKIVEQQPGESTGREFFKSAGGSGQDAR